MYRVTNPATGELVETFPTATDTEIASALDRSHAGYLAWRETPIEERAQLMLKVAQVFTARAEELAAIIAQEMGKRISEGIGELGVVSDIFTYYGENGPDLAADQPIATKRGSAIIQKRPVGSILGIMPWNFPYYQVARFAAPNLVLGNTIILKHAPNCPRSAAAIVDVLREAGVPEDAYINVYATNEQVATMLADPRVQGVSLTGSERAGAAVAAEAGRNLKKVVLELGGSDPLIVLDTMDLAKTAKVVARARMSNSGQACNAPKRVIVMDDVYDEFVKSLGAIMADYIAGDPADPATTLAPVASQAAADGLLAQIQDAVDKGATLVTGGAQVDRPGAFVQPTVLTGITKSMRAYSEELFGPAVAVYKVSTEEEAVELANDSLYGLGSSVFSDDPERAQRVASRIDAGMVYINQAGGSSAEVPFGGIKRSGVGRELGPLGMDEFMNKRVVVGS